MSANAVLEPLPASVEQPLSPKHRIPEPQEFLTTHEICDRLGISRWTWRRWVRSKQAPQRNAKLPGHPRWAVVDVDRFTYGSFFTAHKRAMREQSVSVHAGSLKEASDAR